MILDEVNNIIYATSQNVKEDEPAKDMLLLKLTFDATFDTLTTHQVTKITGIADTAKVVALRQAEDILHIVVSDVGSDSTYYARYNFLTLTETTVKVYDQDLKTLTAVLYGGDST